jgi:hypothetical protein
LSGIPRGLAIKICQVIVAQSLNGAIWTPLLNSPDRTDQYRGREFVFRWDQGQGVLTQTPSVRIRGTSAWGKKSVFVARTSDIRATLSIGEIHAQNGVAVVPKKEQDLAAFWIYCSSPDYRDEVRKFLVP